MFRLRQKVNLEDCSFHGTILAIDDKELSGFLKYVIGMKNILPPNHRQWSYRINIGAYVENGLWEGIMVNSTQIVDKEELKEFKSIVWFSEQQLTPLTILKKEKYESKG